jgi:DNA-directed RNA polymerase specialized sigma24 family protein
MKESDALRAMRAKVEANEAALRALKVEREQLQRELDAELRLEQDRFARAVMAKRELGMTLADIAHAMDCSVPTVSRAIARWRHIEGLPRVAARRQRTRAR